MKYSLGPRLVVEIIESEESAKEDFLQENKHRKVAARGRKIMVAVNCVRSLEKRESKSLIKYHME